MNILSDMIRHPIGPIAERIAEMSRQDICTSVIVAAELRYGALKRGSPRLTSRVADLLGTLDVLAVEPPADAVYAELRARLERTGTPIGPNDLLIAAQALALGLTLVTDNEREFSCVAELSIENWLR